MSRTLNQTGLVSVALCTYNGDRFLEEQLDSIVLQDYPFLEIVISDDCSGDRTWEILESYQERFPEQIRLYRNEQNMGYNRNFEIALSHCKGDYIAIADQDDIWLKDKLSSQVKALEEAPDTILSYCVSKNFSSKKFSMHGDNRNWTHMFNGNDVREFIFRNHVSGHCMLFRSSLLEKVLPLPEGLIYDWWIAASATCYGNIRSIHKVLVMRRIHGKNAYKGRKNISSSKLKTYLSLTKAVPERHPVQAAYLPLVQAAGHLLSRKLKERAGEFDLRLFFFVYRNREVFFRYKKRNSTLMRQWSLLKASYSIARQ